VFEAMKQDIDFRHKTYVNIATKTAITGSPCTGVLFQKSTKALFQIPIFTFSWIMDCDILPNRTRKNAII